MSDKSKKNPPARKRVISFGSTSCVVRCFPSNGSGTLSLSTYQTQDCVDRNFEQTQRIVNRLDGIHVKEALAPSVADMSASIVDSNTLTDVLEFPKDIKIRRKKDLPADGISLLPKQTAVMGLGGCRCAVAIGEHHCLIVHIGADSLIDRGRIESIVRGDGNVSTREHESVIYAIVQFFDSHGIAPSDVMIHCLFGLANYTHDLEHPTYARYNEKLVEDITLKYEGRADKPVVKVENGVASFNLFQIIKAQCRRVGIKKVWDEYLIPLDGHFGNTRHPNEHMRYERNLVTASRIS